MHSALTSLFDLIYPPRCLITGDLIAVQGGISPSYWQALTFITPPLCSCCGMPFPHEGLAGEEGDEPQILLCLSCIEKKPVYHRARAALVYDDFSSQMIMKFKHADGLALAPLLAGLLRGSGGELLNGADLLVPVPLHPLRLLKRKYNQSAELVRHLSRLSGVKAEMQVLQRAKYTRSQGGLSGKERRKNVRKVFRVPEARRQKLADKHVVLIDDVYTTGATLEECTRALLGAGAARVDCLCVARVLRPSSVR